MKKLLKTGSPNDMDEAECCVEAVPDLLDVEVIDVE